MGTASSGTWEILISMDSRALLPPSGLVPVDAGELILAGACFLRYRVDTPAPSRVSCILTFGSSIFAWTDSPLQLALPMESGPKGGSLPIFVKSLIEPLKLSPMDLNILPPAPLHLPPTRPCPSHSQPARWLHHPPPGLCPWRFSFLPGLIPTTTYSGTVSSFMDVK